MPCICVMELNGYRLLLTLKCEDATVFAKDEKIMISPPYLGAIICIWCSQMLLIRAGG